MINRRRLMASALATLAISGGTRASTAPRLVVLTPGSAQWPQQVFISALERLGFRDGENVVIEIVSADYRVDRLPTLARDVVATRPTMILAINTPSTRAAATATSSIPIVAGIVGDPIGMGFARSVAKPGGNITGVSNMSADLTSKRTALLLELVPRARQIALFLHPDDPVTAPQLRDIEERSSDLRIQVRLFPMRTEADLRQGIVAAREWKADGMVRLAGQSFAIGAATASLATEARLPSMMTQRSDVAAGGLVSYFAHHDELWRRCAAQAAAILNGQAPSEIAFELPTRFELFVNRTTAASLGLTIPLSILIRADEVIE